MTAHTDPAVLLADARTSIADLQAADDTARRTVKAATAGIERQRAEVDLLRLRLNQPPAGPDTFEQAAEFAQVAASHGVDLADTGVST